MDLNAAYEDNALGWLPLKRYEGAVYQRWASVYYLKQMAAALQYLQENNLLVYEDLAAKAEAAAARMHSASDGLQQTESAMNRNAERKWSGSGMTQTTRSKATPLRVNLTRSELVWGATPTSIIQLCTDI